MEGKRVLAPIVALGVLVAIVASPACGEALLDADEPIPPPRPDASGDTGVAPNGGADGGGGGDAADAGDAGDAGDSGAPSACSPDLPFGVPELLSEIAPLGDVTSVRLDRDGGALAFVAADAGAPDFFDILEVSFPMQPAELPTRLVSTADHESTPAPLAGGMKVYFDRAGDGGTREIATGSRTQPGQKLDGLATEPLPLSPLGGSAMHAWAIARPDVLYYVVEPATANSADVYRAEKNGGTWEANGQLTSAFDETHPVVTDDELVMYYAFSESGKRKIYVATRGLPNDPWTGKIPLDAANDAAANDEPSWISPDQCTLFFTSDRSGASRAYKIVRQR